MGSFDVGQTPTLSGDQALLQRLSSMERRLSALERRTVATTTIPTGSGPPLLDAGSVPEGTRIFFAAQGVEYLSDGAAWRNSPFEWS